MDCLAICGNHCQPVTFGMEHKLLICKGLSCFYKLLTFDGDLSGAHRGESVDHAEPVASAGCHREDLQRSVGHEAGVGVAELAFAVDEHRLGVLTGVDGQSSRVSLGGVFVHPIGQQHDVRCQVEVVQVRIWVARWWLTNDNRAM